MTGQRFGFAPFASFPSPGAWPATTGAPGSWPQGGGELTAAVSSLLALLQGQVTPGSLGDVATAQPAAAPDDERRATEAFLRDVTAATLRKLYKYLENAAPRHAEIAACYPPLQQAIRAYRARDYGHALTASYQVYRMIAALQSRHLDLPEVADEALPSGEAAAPRA